MSETMQFSAALEQACRDAAPRLLPLALTGGALALAGALAVTGALQAGLVTAGGAVLAIALSVRFLAGRRKARVSAMIASVGAFHEADESVVAVTDEAGRLVWANAAACALTGMSVGEPLANALGGRFAAPGAIVGRLSAVARKQGTAREDRVNRNGHTRLTAVAGAQDHVLWRLEDVAPHGAVAGSMELGLPSCVIDAAGAVVSSGSAMTELLGEPPERLERLVTDLPIRSGHVHDVATREGLQRRRVVEIAGELGAEIYVLPEGTAAGSDAAELFDALPVPLLKIASDGRVQVANRSARELLGNAIPQGTNLADLVSGLGRSVSDWLREAAAGRGLNRSEFLQVTTDGRDVFVQVTLKRAAEPGASHLVAVLNDATELKTLEAQFVQSQKMQAIGQLAGGVAHDFNNLLTAISGHCDLLLLRHDQGDPEYGDLVQIHQNANRAASLVGQLLAFSRKQTLQPQMIDLRDALADLTHLLNRLVGERVRLTLRHDPALPSIRADKRQLEQVIMNLVVNARDAMPSGGEIVIETEAVMLKAETRRNRAAIPPGDYVVVRVSDQGIGIPPEKLSKIFEPFYTTKKTGEGTGLGLSTAYGIVKQTGGYIFADSTPGEGTVFTLFLPAYREAATPKPALPAPHAAAHLPAARSDAVVLLVEDEAPVRAFASRALRLRGYTVLEAENAEEALSQLADGELKVDLFVTDVVMPGMDGPTWVRIALKDRPDTRIVFVSGYAEDALDEHHGRIPNSVFLPKPFSLQDLTLTVQKQLG